jgi:hypothetical protein
MGRPTFFDRETCPGVATARNAAISGVEEPPGGEGLSGPRRGRSITLAPLVTSGLCRQIGPRS